MYQAKIDIFHKDTTLTKNTKLSFSRDINFITP